MQRPAICLLSALTAVPAAAAAPEDLRVNAARIEAHIHELSSYGRNPQGGVSRVAFSRADIEGRAYVERLMRQAALAVSIDAAGNIVGRRRGSEPDLAPIVFGSHIDSVPGGGNYDGDVGVIAAIEVARTLEEAGHRTRHPLEVIVFCDEEGGLTGSRALIGDLGEETLDLVSHSGLTIREGIRAIGGDPERLAEAVRGPGEITAFLELHIEQGAVLDEAGINIGVVEGIVGIEWWDVVIEGVANHAGTTPMDRRTDALLAAADYVRAVNRVVLSEPGRQVGTVGRISAHPGAPNVIPGRVDASLEIRDLDAAKIERLFARVVEETRAIEESSGARFTFTRLDVASEPALTDPRVRRVIAGVAERLGLSHLEMPSGAGHDAQDLARIAPTGMIFVPSVGGVSHAPEEYTAPEDMANGANVLLWTILEIDRGALDEPAADPGEVGAGL